MYGSADAPSSSVVVTGNNGATINNLGTAYINRGDTGLAAYAGTGDAIVNAGAGTLIGRNVGAEAGYQYRQCDDHRIGCDDRRILGGVGVR